MDTRLLSSFREELTKVGAKLPREVRGNKLFRSGKKPIGISKLLEKENAITKLSYQGSTVSTLAPAVDPSAARSRNYPGRIPSKDDQVVIPSREDGREHATYQNGPSTTMQDVMANTERSKEGSIPWIASQHAEHVTDLAGLGLMAASSADKLRRQLRRDKDMEAGETARIGADTAGLGVMAVPTIAALGARTLTPHHAGGGSRATNAINALGLGSLLLSAGDKLQARLRSNEGEDPSKKQLMGHAGHAVADIAGLGILAAPALREAVKTRKLPWDQAALLGGYGTLIAPSVGDLHEHYTGRENALSSGPLRSATELAGLGMLAAPSMSHLLRGGHLCPLIKPHLMEASQR